MQNLMILKQNIGIDVSESNLEATIGALLENGDFQVYASKSFHNNSSGIKAFIEWMEKWRKKKGDTQKELHITTEPTGIYHENLAYSLYEKGYKLHLVLPNQAKMFAESLGMKLKTDKVDAKALARMGAERKMRVWQPISKYLRNLKSLTREYKQRTEQQTQVKNQLHALKNSYNPNPVAIKRTQELINFIQGQIKSIYKDIKNFIKKDRKLAHKIDIITSINGIGLLSAAIVVAETDGFAQFTNAKQLQSYAGYDVSIKQSGKWSGKVKISKKGNSAIRAALYMPATTAIKHNKVFKAFNQRLLEKGKNSMVANAAVQRKLLVLIFTLWKNDTYFDPDYHFDKGKKKNNSTKASSELNPNKKANKNKDKHREMPEPESSFGLDNSKKAVGKKEPTALDRHRFNASPYVFLRSKTNIEKL